MIILKKFYQQLKRIMKKHKSNKKFENSYFEGYFKGAVGNFTDKDLAVSRNWFDAWLKVVDGFLDISNGKGKKAIEIGCSIGGASSLLSDRGFDVLASDISNHAVKKSSHLNQKIRYRVLDIQQSINIREKFDYLFAFEVVEHLHSPERAINNMYSLLKPGGKIIISSPYPYMWNMKDPTHINVRFPHEWINLLRQAGFQKVAYKKFSLIPFFYKFNKNFQIIIPFHIPIPLINNPIIFVGDRP